MRTFNLPKTFTVVCATKANKEASAVEQTLTFTFAEDFTDSDLQALIQRSVVIASQAEDRAKANRAENPVAIPATKSIVISKASVRTSDPDKPFRDAIAKMSGIKAEDVTPEQIAMAKQMLKGIVTE